MADSPRWRMPALLGLWAVVMGALSSMSGCYGRACEGDVQVFGRNPGEGRLVSETDWESGPIDGVYLEFPKQRTWIFDVADLSGRLPFSIHPQVSAQRDPFREFGNFTTAGGNLAEISSVSPGKWVVRNGTCADYFLRVTVELGPLPPPVASVPEGGAPDAEPDAGADADADAGSDAEAGP